MIKRTLTIPIYECKVVVVLAPDINEEARRIYKKHKLRHDGQEDYACVICAPENIHTYYLLLGTSHLTLNLLVHELTHLGGTILMDRGEEAINSEPLAYLNGYLAEAVQKIMQRHNIEFIKPKLHARSNLQKKAGGDPSHPVDRKQSD